MDLTAVSPIAIISGWLSSWIVELAKNHPRIPLSPDNVKLIKNILRVVGALIVVAVAYVDGRLADGSVSLQDGLTAVWDLIQFLVAGKLAYKNGIQKNGPPALPGAPEPEAAVDPATI